MNISLTGNLSELLRRKDKSPQFTYCPNCQKAYWQGTHHKKLSARIGSFLP